jgi:hypothetical protein
LRRAAHYLPLRHFIDGIDTALMWYTPFTPS